MTIAPAPRFPERAPQMFERTMGPNMPGQRGPERFMEGVVTDTDVPHDFAVGIAQGNPKPGRPNRNQNVYEKPAEETMRERAHVGSASWVTAVPVLAEFSDGAFAGYGQPTYEQIDNNGMRQQRPNAATVRD